MPYVNSARQERTKHEDGGSQADQAGGGSGKIKVGHEGSSAPDPGFKSAEQFLGAELPGELPVNGVQVVKGASTPQFAGPMKGGPNPKYAGGKVQKPKAAEEAGH